MGLPIVVFSNGMETQGRNVLKKCSLGGCANAAIKLDQLTLRDANQSRQSNPVIRILLHSSSNVDDIISCTPPTPFGPSSDQNPAATPKQPTKLFRFAQLIDLSLFGNLQSYLFAKI